MFQKKDVLYSTAEGDLHAPLQFHPLIEVNGQYACECMPIERPPGFVRPHAAIAPMVTI